MTTDSVDFRLGRIEGRLDAVVTYKWLAGLLAAQTLAIIGVLVAIINTLPT